MLIISRKNGQKIMINDDIEITIVESRNGSCKVAIQAPKSFKIYREEIYVQIKLANLMGQESSPDLLDKASELFSKKDIHQNATINFNAVNTKTNDDKVENNNLKKVIIKKQNNNDKL